MVHMGNNDCAPLINNHFQAWEYGPVQPELYHKVKFCGDNPIPNIFFGTADIGGTLEAAMWVRPVTSAGIGFVGSFKAQECTENMPNSTIGQTSEQCQAR
jgi:Protein of unknown function (DUF4065)